LEVFVAKTLRIHTLAKELGVPSKEIIAKCNAEGVEPPIKNHMTAIPVGLAESIREWFSPGSDVTTIEVAPHVDLEKIRVEPKLEEVVEVPVEEEVVEEPVAEEVEVAASEPAPVEAPTEEIQIAAAQQQEETLEVSEPLAPAARQEEPVAPPPPERPVEPVHTGRSRGALRVTAPPAELIEQIKPAGPKLVPAPAVLQGPRVVRIEQPDPVQAPRPRPAAYRPAEPGMPEPVGEGRARTARGPGTPGGPGVRDDREGPARGRSPRRRGGVGAGADVVERLKEWRDQDVIERKERLANVTGHGIRARRSAERRRQSSSPAVDATRRREVEIVAPIALKDFCSAVGTPFNVISSKLIEQAGKMMRINDTIDAETAEMLALDLGVSLVVRRAQTAFEKLEAEVEKRERNNLKPRPPVVAMLGHVDHGKTSLLDAIRTTNVAAGEAGGITQHIGAYRIDRGDWHVTFLDTPGHEAFTAMRARGANLTDVVVLVVAADDGVMPQTVEALNHAKAAGVQIVVALNKIDLPGVDLNRIYAQLSEHGLTPSEWGGTTDVIKTSATTGQGIDDLLAHLSTLSELLDLKADATLPAVASVIEAQMREGRGIVAQVLVREGTLKPGQIVVCGPAAGRVRSLTDDRGKRMTSAGPGTPVEVVGLDEMPDTGDKLFVLGNLSQAKSIAEEVRVTRRSAALVSRQTPQTLEDLLRSGEEAGIPELNIILKADNQGTLEAVTGKLREFPGDKARLKILHAGVGVVTEADVALALASSAMIIGFHIVAEERARQQAERSGVEIRLYRVIYEVLDDVHKALEGLLAPEEREEVRSRVEVREVFNITRVGTVAGCYVVDGTIGRSHRVRLIRDGRIVLEGAPLDSLKRFKDDAKEVRAGFECGIRIAGYNDVKPGDIIESFQIVEVAQTL